MIDLDKLKELVDLMVQNDLSELDLHDSDQTVTIKRGSAHHSGPVYQPAPQIHAPGMAQTLSLTAPASVAGAGTPAEDVGLIAVLSPMVGTFYSSSSPDNPPFVSVGSSIGADTVVCLIEAMKVFNEVKAEHAGKIERILVQSGAAVEYGQKLFLIRPS